MIVLGKKGKRYPPRFQFQVVLKGDRDAVVNRPKIAGDCFC